jgi:hypothetical protein
MRKGIAATLTALALLMFHADDAHAYVNGWNFIRAYKLLWD